VVRKYGVTKGARIWRSMKKPRYAANVGTHLGAVHAAKKAGYSRPHGYFKQLGKLGAAKRWNKRRPSHLVKRGGHMIAANRGRRFGRRFGFNPSGGFAAFKSSFKEMLSVDTLIEAATVSGGSLVAVGLPNLALGYLQRADGTSPVPEVLRTGWGKYLLNLVATGLASGTAAWFGKGKIAKNLLIGGIAGTITEVVTKEVLPKAAPAFAAKAGLSGMGILTGEVERAVERAVDEELARQGLSDYLVPGEAANPALADYLVPAEAAAPALGILTDAGTQF
jgi:hypothetical protein